LSNKLSQSQSILFKILNKIPLFANFSNQNKLLLISVCKSKNFAEGDIIFRIDSDPTEMYLIIAGYVDIVLRNNQIVATIKPGELFGEMGVFTGMPRTATALAKTAVKSFIIKKTELDTLTLQYPKLGRDLFRNVIAMLAARIRENNELIKNLNKEIDRLEERIKELSDKG